MLKTQLGEFTLSGGESVDEVGSVDELPFLEVIFSGLFVEDVDEGH